MLVIELCLTFYDPTDCSHQASVHGIFQARIQEWVAIPFSRGSSRSKDQTWVSHIAGGFFTTRESELFLEIAVEGSVHKMAAHPPAQLATASTRALGKVVSWVEVRVECASTKTGVLESHYFIPLTLNSSDWHHSLSKLHSQGAVVCGLCDCVKGGWGLGTPSPGDETRGHLKALPAQSVRHPLNALGLVVL